MNVTLVTTPVQQNKYVSISREATHAWILYSAPSPTSKLATSECFIRRWRLNPPSCSRCSSPPTSTSPSLSLRSQCMCSTENPACRDKPFTILFRHMDLSSGRSVPADIFQMQATTRYPGAFYIFQIKSGNDGREFYMRVSGCSWDCWSQFCIDVSVNTNSRAEVELVQQLEMDPVFSIYVVLTKFPQRFESKQSFKTVLFCIYARLYFLLSLQNQ